jgi:hypothetical protein
MEEAVGWKSLRADLIHVKFTRSTSLKIIPLSTNIDYPFLKDRILRFWNPTVSSIRATIATQLPGGGLACLPVGRGRGDVFFY